VLAGVWGVTIDDRWFCSQGCVEQMLRRLFADAPAPQMPVPVPGPPHLRLGALLRHHGALSADQLHNALEEQRTSGLKLGAQAKAMFGVDGALVLKALATQAGARYLTAIDPTTVRDAPGGLSREAIHALGLIPFSQPDERRCVHVASKAPVPWDAVKALRRLADWNPELYLVEDETWNQLLDHYGVAVAASPRSTAAVRANGVLVHDQQAAVTQIANIAAASRRSHLADAHWDPYTMVRVHGDRMVQDVLFSRTAGEGASWRAASTSR
jgi:hypothetical protein